MGRLLATTAATVEDRQIATHLDRATRELEQAIRVARTARGNYRARRVERDLNRLLNGLDSIGTIGPRFGEADDPDFMSEDERNRQARERREAERLAALQPEAEDSEEGDG